MKVDEVKCRYQMVSDSRLRVRHLEALHEHSGSAEPVAAAVLARREAHSAGVCGMCHMDGTARPVLSTPKLISCCSVLCRACESMRLLTTADGMLSRTGTSVYCTWSLTEPKTP